jgi:hypothetical protein
VLDFLFAQKALELTDITKTQITEKSVSLNYVHGIWYEVSVWPPPGLCCSRARVCMPRLCRRAAEPPAARAAALCDTRLHARAQLPAKAAVLAHIDKGGARPPRKARALLVMGLTKPPTVREVLVTLSTGGDGQVRVSNLERANIHSSKLPALPYSQRPHGVMDQVG